MDALFKEIKHETFHALRNSNRRVVQGAVLRHACDFNIPADVEFDKGQFVLVLESKDLLKDCLIPAILETEVDGEVIFTGRCFYAQIPFNELEGVKEGLKEAWDKGMIK